MRADPSFQAAHEQQQAAEAAPTVQAGGDVITVVQAVEQVTAPSEPPSLGALSSAGSDVNPSLTDRLTTNAGNEGGSTTDTDQTAASQGVTSVTQASGILRIIFRRP